MFVIFIFCFSFHPFCLLLKLYSVFFSGMYERVCVGAIIYCEYVLFLLELFMKLSIETLLRQLNRMHNRKLAQVFHDKQQDRCLEKKTKERAVRFYHVGKFDIRKCKQKSKNGDDLKSFTKKAKAHKKSFLTSGVEMPNQALLTTIFTCTSCKCYSIIIILMD